MSRARQVTSLVRQALGVVRSRARSQKQPAQSPTPRTFTSAPAPAPASSGEVQVSYSPTPDGQADPGEVVWAWVPYEEDPSQGKDRPVLVIGTAGAQLATLMLTSQDHDRDAEQEASWGRYWMDVGSGDWDSEHRPSEVRLDRLILLDPQAVRREGATLDKTIFDQVVAASQQYR